jgi:curli production assembly/transport component CsgG
VSPNVCPPGRFLARAGVVLLLATGGCARYAAPFETDRPLPGPVTRTNEKLTSLPAPHEQVVAAVYRFRDQTGQYKASDVIASWSTAVTQGATSILIRAMEESGWFVAIEREGLSNLLSERQIIQAIRAQYEGPAGERLGPLPPLLYAGILLEGGIIGYDTNLLTGGIGARYFGAGASAQFREDQVTVYLRAVSTQTGRVLKTVHTTKTILSQRTDAGIFRFVNVDRLLEAEIGYSVNEPPVVAVTEAIEEAVRSLIVEGIRDGLWALQDPEADRDHPALRSYDASLARAGSYDAWGIDASRDRTGSSLVLAGGARRYQGNYRSPLTRPAGEVAVRWLASPGVGLGVAASVGEIGAETAFTSMTAAVEALGVYYILPRANLSPFIRAGGGLMGVDLAASNIVLGETLFPFVSLGGGMEAFLGRSMALNIALVNQYALMDGLDGIAEGKGRDSVWSLTAGLALYRRTGR